MEHSERAHALLSASGSERWLKCPPSARLEEDVPDKDTSYSKEGELAHEVAEIVLLHKLNMATDGLRNATIAHLRKKELFQEEMIGYAEDYANYIEEKWLAAQARDKSAHISIEAKLDYSHYVPEGFGTGDCVIFDNNQITVIDFKYGKGEEVSAVDNTQMMLYGAGALENVLYEPINLELCIFQPRIKKEAEEWIIPTIELNKWLEEVVIPAAKLAFNGEGECCPGSHCKWCKIKAVCKARKKTYLGLYESHGSQANLLSIKEISDLLPWLDSIQKWAKDIQNFALVEALNGTKFDGYKVVEGRSNRTYTDEIAVVDALEEAGYKAEMAYSQSLISITDMQKLLGKKQFDEILGNLIVKPTGKPALVPDYDKRPEMDLNILNEFENLDKEE